METFELKTNIEEIIEYNNIVVEKIEEVVIPEKIEVIKTPYTIGTVRQAIIDIANEIEVLQTKKTELENIKTLIEIEADKVINAIK